MRKLGLLCFGLLLPMLGCKRSDSAPGAGSGGQVSKPAPPVPTATGGGCANLQEVRLYLFAWNSQAGLALATRRSLPPRWRGVRRRSPAAALTRGRMAHAR